MLKIKTASFGNYFYIIGYLLFFLMLFLASTSQDIKKVLLLILLIGIGIRLIVRQGRMKISKNIVFAFLALVFMGLLGQIIGMINQTPGYLSTYTVYVMYPLIYIFIIEAIQDINKVVSIFKVLILSGIAISLYILSFIFVKIGILPDFFFIPLDLDERLGLHSGYIELNMNSLTSIIYIFPFLYSLLLSKNDFNLFTPKWNKIIILAFILALIISIISGRRSLWLIMVFGMFLHLFFMSFYKKSFFKFRFSFSKILGVFVLLMVIVFGFYKLDLSFMSIIDNIAFGFDASQEQSARVKAEEFKALMDGFLNSPLVGYGHGSSPLSMMDRVEPWAFELSYIALLYHTGIVGVLTYGFFILWIVYIGIKIISTRTIYSEMMIPVLVATICFLISNSVNPYLEKFDFIWVVLFMPLVVINLFIFEQKKDINT